MSITGRRKSWRQQLIAMISAAALVGGIVTYFALGADAAHSDTSFEYDGNIDDDSFDPDDEEVNVAPYDWGSIFSSTGAQSPKLPSEDRPGFIDAGFDDDWDFPDRSTFTTGSKDILDVSAWACTDSNNLGGKFDILNAYSTIYERNGFTYLAFGIERAATEGDGNMGFWFLKDGSANCEKTGKGKAPSFTGAHQNGDIFVVSGFSNGGTKATIQAYQWNNGALIPALGDSVTNVNCVTGDHNADKDGNGDKDINSGCGIVNTAELDTPWNSPDKNGGLLDVNAFYEGFVRFPSNALQGCFATFVANTRSSTSPTATIMDFSRGTFPRCQPGTSLTLDSAYKVEGETETEIPDITDVDPEGEAEPDGDLDITAYVGDTVKLVFAELNDGSSQLSKPTGLEFVISDDCSLSGVETDGVNDGDVGDPDLELADDPLEANGKSDPGETWLYSCEVAVDDDTDIVTAFGHGIDPLLGTGKVKDVTWCTTVEGVLVEDEVNNPILDPADVVHCDQDERADVDFTILAPSTAMTASAEIEVIFYEENDENAPLARPGGGEFVTMSGTDACDTFGPVLVDDDNEETTDPNVGDIGDPDVEGDDLEGNDVLDPDEKFQYKCTISIAEGTTGSFDATATGHGMTGNFDVTKCVEDEDGVVILDEDTGLPTASDPQAIDGTDPPVICDTDEQRSISVSIT